MRTATWSLPTPRRDAVAGCVLGVFRAGICDATITTNRPGRNRTTAAKFGPLIAGAGNEPHDDSNAAWPAGPWQACVQALRDLASDAACPSPRSRGTHPCPELARRCHGRSRLDVISSSMSAISTTARAVAKARPPVRAALAGSSPAPGALQSARAFASGHGPIRYRRQLQLHRRQRPPQHKASQIFTLFRGSAGMIGRGAYGRRGGLWGAPLRCLNFSVHVLG